MIESVSCRIQRQEGRGDGGSATKREDDDDTWCLEEDEEIEMGDGSQHPYKRHKWILVAAWSDIDLEETYRRAAIFLTDDFNIAGDLPQHRWPESGEKKIGPFSVK